MTWLECFVYGLISGFSELLPVSSVAHQTLLLRLTGCNDHLWLRFCAHLGTLVALLVCCTPALLRLRRERKIAATPKKRRRRQPDFATLMESKVLRMTVLFALLPFLTYGLVCDLYQRLWVLAILLGINGIILYIPQHMPSANKTAQSLSGLDTMLIGLAAGAGIIPGISRMGMTLSVAQMRGADRRYGMELALLSSIPVLLILMIISAFQAVTATVATVSILCCAIVAVSSFVASYLGVVMMRFLAVKTGFSSFAYYCWGAALFALIIYLI